MRCLVVLLLAATSVTALFFGNELGLKDRIRVALRARAESGVHVRFSCEDLASWADLYANSDQITLCLNVLENLLLPDHISAAATPAIIALITPYSSYATYVAESERTVTQMANQLNCENLCDIGHTASTLINQTWTAIHAVNHINNYCQTATADNMTQTAIALSQTCQILYKSSCDNSYAQSCPEVYQK